MSLLMRPIGVACNRPRNTEMLRASYAMRWGTAEAGAVYRARRRGGVSSCTVRFETIVTWSQDLSQGNGAETYVQYT